MSLDVVLLILRVVIAIALYAFLGVLVILLWQDIYHSAGQTGKDKTISSAQLVVVGCDESVPLELGRAYPLRPHTIIGRAPTSTIIIPDSFASTEHAHIVLRNGQWWIDDRQSRNGTTVNDITITQPVVISSGDVIGVGRVEFKMELASA